MREIDSAVCSCGGVVKKVAAYQSEIMDRCECCVKALECDKCKTRFALHLEAPEWNPS
jgi:hypothetical protein